MGGLGTQDAVLHLDASAGYALEAGMASGPAGADPAFSHLVLYEPVDAEHFAVEPVTHVNDGIGLHEQGVPGTGVVVLEPGETFTAGFAIELSG